MTKTTKTSPVVLDDAELASATGAGVASRPENKMHDIIISSAKGGQKGGVSQPTQDAYNLAGEAIH